MSKRQRWNERYANRALVWSAEPNRLFATEVTSLEPGRALDIACGEGRNAIWLAEKGWDVTAVDFSKTGIDKGKQIARKRGVSLNWIVEDVSVWQPSENTYDLVAILYLHTDVEERQKWLTNTIGSVKHGGTLIYIAHDPSNIEDGVGGPQDPDQVPGLAEIKNSLGDFQIEIARVTKRSVENDPGHSKKLRGTALDSFIRATRL